MLTDIILITAVTVFVIDLSGAKDTLLDVVNLWARPRGWEFKSLKPFTCSLCTTWWLGLAYLLATRQLSMGSVALVALCSYMTVPVQEALLLVWDAARKLIGTLQKLIDKL